MNIVEAYEEMKNGREVRCDDCYRYQIIKVVTYQGHRREIENEATIIQQKIPWGKEWNHITFMDLSRVFSNKWRIC